MTDEHHEDCNMFLMTILCHGNKHGHLLDKHKNKAWDTEEFVGDLSEVETLTGKPKVIIMQACRGSRYFHNSYLCNFYNQQHPYFCVSKIDKNKIYY